MPSTAGGWGADVSNPRAPLASTSRSVSPGAGRTHEERGRRGHRPAQHTREGHEGQAVAIIIAIINPGTAVSACTPVPVQTWGRDRETTGTAQTGPPLVYSMPATQ